VSAAEHDPEIARPSTVDNAQPSTALGHPRLHLRRTDSTNARARALALAGAPHGTLVTATEQTAGRGRQGRRWSAPAGSSLLLSLVLRTGSPGERGAAPDPPHPLLPLAAAVAVCDVAGSDARIKWPNDIVFERPRPDDAEADRSAGQIGPPGAPAAAPATRTTLAKVAGILLEGRPQEGWAVLGIGLNVAVRLTELPAELRPNAATLGLGATAIEPLLARLLGALERRLHEPSAQTLAAWRARDALRGRELAWATGRGRAAGIDGEGRLVVALPGGGRTTLAAGEVHLSGVD
jgi:BirA family transcriptional regulator, biotin operon repressor / biotin---[acetyl-CoA-carboxylase] ligase